LDDADFFQVAYFTGLLADLDWVRDNRLDPAAEPPSERAGLLRDLARADPREFGAVYALAVRGQGGEDITRLRAELRLEMVKVTIPLTHLNARATARLATIAGNN
jgi:hypothetical protein